MLKRFVSGLAALGDVNESSFMAGLHSFAILDCFFASWGGVDIAGLDNSTCLEGI